MAPIALASQLPGPVAYVLAGGASYGAVQVGLLQALAETDIRPDFVVGTSVGALNGAAVAENPTAAAGRLGLLWSSITRKEIFGKVLDNARALAARKGSLTDHEGLRAVLEDVLVARDFSELTLPLTAVTTDFDTGEPVLLSDGDLVSALLASSAIPLVFPSVEWEGRTLVDGGLVANVPVGFAAGQGAQTIVVLDCGFTVGASQRDDTFTGKMLRSAAILADQQVRRDLAWVADRTVIYLPGPWPIGSRPDDFSRSAEMASDAYHLASAWLRDLDVSDPGVYGHLPADAVRK